MVNAMNKSAMKQSDINAKRIQRAVTGLIIPMMKIPAVCKHAESIIETGANDAELAIGIRSFLNGDA